MIGLLGRYACRLTHTGIVSLTGEGTRDVETWEDAPTDRGGWVSGPGGAYVASVPTDGVYLCTALLEASAGDAGNNPVEAGVHLFYPGGALAVLSPEFAHDDFGGTSWVTMTGAALVRLSAGDLISCSIVVADADPALASVGFHLLALDLVRIGSAP